MYGKLVRIVQVIAVKSMSAIIQALTTEGFIVAADGRACRGHEIISNGRQKVFQITSANGPLSLAICGASDIGLKDDTYFDVIEEVLTSSRILRQETTYDLRAYASLLIEPVFRRLLDRNGGPEFTPSESETGEPGSISTLFLNGYVKGCPDSIEIRLCHVGGLAKEPSIKDTRLEHGPWVHGSALLTRSMIQNRDPRWLAYLGFPLDLRSTHLTPRGAIDLACSYIAACADPLAIETDGFCKSVGGHIHIANVSLRDGFEWVPGFEPLVVKA